MSKGDMFGEQSALNDLPNPYTIVAASSKVEYYKIHRSNLTSFFGGVNGESIN
jgi:CRP-like cAMP-binding protein